MNPFISYQEWQSSIGQRYHAPIFRVTDPEDPNFGYLITKYYFDDKAKPDTYPTYEQWLNDQNKPV